MFSLTIEVLSEKGMRSTVACCRSQCLNPCASQGQQVMVLERCVFSTTLGQGPSSHSLCITDSSPGVFFRRIKLFSSEINFRYRCENSSL